MRRPLRRLLVATIGLVTAAGVGLAGFHYLGHHPSAIEKTAHTRSRQARAAARQAGLSPAVQDLLARAAGAVGATFTVTYRTAQGTTATLAQRPPAKRVDESTGSGADLVTRSLIINDSGSFSCLRESGQWACQRATGKPGELGVFTAQEIKSTTERLAAQRATFRFSVVHRRVASAPVTCLVTTPVHATASSQRGTLCVSAQGVPLLVEGASGRIEATGYRATVSPGALRLPAAVR